ncbi:MAG TPA: mannitol dehydrogenase family protein [Microcella sp.]|nr:mannitol dehydrogenase family protein [Microcella sp.]
MVTLSRETLPHIDQRVGRPDYLAEERSASIVHFGVGGFHRSHQAMFIDRLLTAGHRDWAICGVGVLPFDRAIRDALAHQDGLYTLVTTSEDGTSAAQIIGSIAEYLYYPDNPQAVLDKLAHPSTRIVSLTITEGGYGVTDTTGEFEPTDELTIGDLTSDRIPCSVLGLIVDGLARRRRDGVPPFTVVSCDNIQGNGHVARTAVTAFARHKDPGLAEWIDERVAFPNSMVDRITPVTTEQTRAMVRDEYGIDDAYPVLAEAFAQWVIEDDFSMGRPPLEEVGVHIVDDVEPYELMKLRLLNASHQAMAFTGILAGYTFVHEVCRQSLFEDFLMGYMRDEAVPTLRPVPGVDLDAYCRQLVERFTNEAILDTLARLAVDASDRIPKFLLPVIRAQVARGGQTQHATLALASWSLYLDQHSGDDASTPIVDTRRSGLLAAVRSEGETPGAFLDYRDVFGDLGAEQSVRDEFVHWRQVIAEEGILAAMSRVTA